MKLFSYSNSTSPTLDNRVKSLKDVLDFCLVDGGPSVAITSITIANSIASVVTTADHYFAVGETVTIDGATTGGNPEPELNGERVILTAADLRHFTFATAAVGAVAGTITAIKSPLGFAKAYTDTNISVYRAASGQRKYLRLDDSGTIIIPITSATISNGIATIVSTNDHYFAVGDSVVIAGATIGGQPAADLNGTKTILTAVDSTHFTVATTDVGVVAGTITATKTQRNIALVAGYNTMTGHSTGTPVFPTVAKYTKGLFWKKGDDDVTLNAQISVSSIVVDDGIATVTTSTAHGLNTRDRTTISGANETLLNGVKRVSAVTSTTEFKYVTTQVDGTATGTIKSLKYAPTKWYVMGDATYFYLFVERKYGIYDLYAFGDSQSVNLSGTTDTFLSGLRPTGGYTVKTSLVDNTYELTTEAYDSSGNSKIWCNINDVATINNSAYGTTVSKNSFNSTDKVSSVYIRYAGDKVAELPGVYLPKVDCLPIYGTNEITTIVPEGDSSNTLRSFVVLTGSPGHIGNIFIDV